MEPKYKRVILKISGEALAGDARFGIDGDTVKVVAKQVKEVYDLGVEVAIVVGGGNFWRGRTSQDMDKATADYMGMLATVMNSLALQEAIENEDYEIDVIFSCFSEKIANVYRKILND